jgi:hypothetical protein
MPPPPARQGPAQRTRIAVASRIRKGYRWDTFRQNTRPRGIANGANNCYRIATLQTLLHLPRFVNWVLDHCEPGKNWNCQPNDWNRVQPVGDRTLDLMRPHAADCISCLLKSLVQAYWGVHNLSPTGHPLPMTLKDPAIVRLNDMARRWVCRDPEGLDATVRSHNMELQDKGESPLAGTELDELKVQERRRNKNAQQCADEYLGNLLGGGVEQSFSAM